MVTIGAGSHQYEVVEAWPNLPDGFEWGQIVQVVVDRADRVLLFHRGTPGVLCFSTAGDYLGAWPASESFTDIHAALLVPGASTDELLIVDRERNAIVRTTLDGDVIWDFVSPLFNLPTDIAVAPNGDMYVADGYGNPYVHRFTAEREHVLTWGEAGEGPGQFKLPHSVWVVSANGAESVYVCDRENNRVQVFTTDGAYLREFGDLNRPTDIIVDAHGVRYITELRQGLSILAADDSLIFRSDGELKRAPGSFIAPHACAVDSHGDLYVVEVLEGQRMQKFRRLRA